MPETLDFFVRLESRPSIGSTGGGLAVEGLCVYSWIFRHRHRLGTVYGVPVSPPHQLSKPIRELSCKDPAVERETPAEEEVSPEPAPIRGRAPSGAVVRRSRYVLLAPMPRRSPLG